MQAPISKSAGIATYTGRKGQTGSTAEAIWTGPSNIVTFVRCLRLLDFDSREDWPGVTEHLFATRASQQNLQQRVKCVEWSLYRLFEIWDPAYTKDKLRPFFPPLAPLQSLNLRAALYRGLTDLKKSGTLGKEAILRKTMLDECKGDKFEDVIRVFAVAVLRKEACRKLERSSPIVTPYSLALTAAESLTAEQREKLVPLVLAHTQTLQRQLSDRRKISEKFRDGQQRLADAERNLAEKRKALLARKEHVPIMTPEELESISDLVRTAWTGNEQWTEILIQGGPTEIDNNDIGNAPHGPAQHLPGTEEREVPLSPSVSLLAELNERTERQQLRLQKWAQFGSSLKDSQKGEQTNSSLPKREPILRFDRHRELQLSVKRNTATSLNSKPSASHADSAELIGTMRSELANLRTNRTPTTSLHKLHSTVQDSTGSNTRGQSKTQIPLALGTRSIDKPSAKHDSKIHGPPVQKGVSSQGDGTKIFAESDDHSAAPKHEGASPITDSPSSPEPSFPVGGLPDDSSLDPQNGNDEPTSTSPSSPLAQQPSPGKPPGTHESADSTPAQSPPDIHHTPDLPSSPPKPKIGNLLERTRQSMAFHPTPSQPALFNQKPSITTQKHTQHPRPSSQLFPRNQFSTPSQIPKHRTPCPHPTHLTPAHNNDTAIPSYSDNLSTLQSALPQSGSSTPRDQLFSDQADYDSVFKSRPRVAVSPPVGSPERDRGKFLGEKDGRLGGDGDGDGDGGRGEVDSSPVRGRR